MFTATNIVLISFIGLLLKVLNLSTGKTGESRKIAQMKIDVGCYLFDNVKMI